MKALHPPSSEKLRTTCWWILLSTCLVFSLFALEMLRLEILGSLGAPQSNSRNSPVAFMFHAGFGGVALVSGILQFNSSLRARHRRLHRTLGHLYLTCICIAGLAGIWSARTFDVPDSARWIFYAVGMYWLMSGAAGFAAIKRGLITQHRRWMTRNFAISLFFVSFALWVPALQLFLIDRWAWPLGLTAAAAGNAAIAEYVIRINRKEHVSMPGTSI